VSQENILTKWVTPVIIWANQEIGIEVRKLSEKNTPRIKLTDNVVENIKIMAPYLDETSQNRVFGMMLEAVKNLEPDADKKAG